MVVVPVVQYPEYGRECSVEHLRWELLFELVAHLLVQPVLVEPPERQAVPMVVQRRLLPVGLQSRDSGKMTAVVPTSCGRVAPLPVWVGLR